MRGKFRLQLPLRDRPDQLAENRPLAGQPQPAGLVPGPLQRRVQQPVTISSRSGTRAASGSIASPGTPGIGTLTPKSAPGAAFSLFTGFTIVLSPAEAAGSPAIVRLPYVINIRT